MSQRMASLEMPTLGYARSAAPTLKVVDTHKDDESINTVRLADNAKETALRCYRALIALYSSSDIRRTIENEKETHETVPYLTENIIVPFYEITVPDELLLKGYSKTTAIDNPRLDNEGRSCQIYDVGGRRTELKKWLTYFQGVDTIIFEVSLTAYCQVLPGIISMNQMQESLMLFESVTKLDGFSTVPILLLFNKFDLLEQRMWKNPIVDYYPEYSGDSDPLTACRFFAAKYSELDCRPHGGLRILLTSAVEPEIFNSTVDELWPDLFGHGLEPIPETPE